MWSRWLSSFPELSLLDLDVGRGQQERRALAQLPPLSNLLMPRDEHILKRIIAYLIERDTVNASTLANEEAKRGSLVPDIHMLAGAFRLAEGRCAEAAAHLRNCYQSDPLPGPATRRLCPSLRLLLRISPCVLLPLYPSAYGASMMYAVALWHSGHGGEALEAIGDMTKEWGLYDELKLLAGQIHIARGQLDKAIHVLSVGEQTQRDAIELARSLYLAYAHYLREEFRSAARELAPAIRLTHDINPHLHARARLLLAELYERNKLLLSALRESGHVAPDEVPGDIAMLMLERESRWITELGLLRDSEIERLSRADDYQMYIPDAATPKAAYSPLDTTRDSVATLRPTAMSWADRRHEEAAIRELRAAAARGETVRPPERVTLSGEALDMRQRIAAAKGWWPQRKQELEEVLPRERLSRQDPAEVGHLRFDFCGSREEEKYHLLGEKRAQFVLTLLGAVVFVGLALWILRSCVY